MERRGQGIGESVLPLQKMACISKVLCVLALLFVIEYAYADPHKPAPAGNNKPAPAMKPIVSAQTAFNGRWELASNNSGVSAMHAILLPKVNKVLMYDASIWKDTGVLLPENKRPCVRRNIKDVSQDDCYSHSVLFDINTAELKPLKVYTDTWCSSGGLTADGELVSTGGYASGAKAVRYLNTCEACDWEEYNAALANDRWYATQVTMANGDFVVFGGRNSFTYEFIPKRGQENKQATFMPLLKETFDQYTNESAGPRARNYTLENNLYPFVYLVPDGNLYIFANNRSVLFSPYQNKVIKEFPALVPGQRNYPQSAASVLLPLKLNSQINPHATPAEVLICGGGLYNNAYYYADEHKIFAKALQDCARMEVTSNNPVWIKEDMPGPRIMGDAMNLPTGEVLIVNGARWGTAGWNCADDPVLEPHLYNPDAPLGQRFKVLAPSNIPRMYHSAAVVLPDGKVLIAGSNTHDGYIFNNVKFPTELRVEKLSPPYLDPALDYLRQHIVSEASDQVTLYGKKISIKVKSQQATLNKDDVKVSMYAPAFTTHSISMNQRLLMLEVSEVINNVWQGAHNIIAFTPGSPTLAPPGYYLLSVVYKGVPAASSMWLQIK